MTSEKCRCGARVLPRKHCERCGVLCTIDPATQVEPKPFVLTHARIEDPNTSKRAALSVEFSASALKGRIVQVMRMTQRCMAVEEVLAHCQDLTKDQIWRRMSDLKNDKVIEDSGSKHTNQNGRKAIRWRLA